MKSLEDVYITHHADRRRQGYVLLGEERGGLLKKWIGTGKNILDIGCRDGSLAAYYREGNTILGLDVDSNALSHAEKTGMSTKQVDLNGEWGVSQKYDCVVMAEVLEHLYYPDIVVKKAAQVLTERGMVVGSVPNAFSIKNRVRLFFLRKKGTPLSDPTHINHFTVRELTQILKTHFKEVEIVGIGRYAMLSRMFPQWFAFDLMFRGKN